MKQSLFVLLIAAFSIISRAQFKNRILFGPNTVTYSIVNDVITVQLVSNNLGWIAYGFGDSMINSDIVSLRYDGTNVLVEDRYATARGVPQLDTTFSGGSNSWTLVTGGYSSSTGWDVTIKRNLSTGDAHDTLILNGKRYDTLFAIGNEMTFTTKHKFFWEFEDIKYSDQQLNDQDGSGSKLTTIFAIVFSMLAVLII